jgi:hypothetical protein
VTEQWRATKHPRDFASDQSRGKTARPAMRVPLYADVNLVFPKDHARVSSCGKERCDMDIEQEIDALTKAISTEAARTDAVTAAIAGVLLASRGNPELAKLVSERLEHEYSMQRAKPQSDHYMRSFEVMREYFRKLVE